MIILGFLVAGIGTVTIGYGINKKKGLVSFGGFLLTLGGILIAVGKKGGKDAPNGSPVLVLVGCVLSFLVMLTFLICILYRKSYNRRLAQAREATGKVYDFLPDAELHSRLTHYGKYQGKEKRIAMLKDMLLVAKDNAKAASHSTSNLIHSVTQPELDWSIMGGLASGIAGPVAGIAAAVDVQMKNAEIRAQNAQNMKVFAPLIGHSSMTASDLRKQETALQIALARAKQCSVGTHSTETCMEKLKLSEPTVKITDSGSCVVSTRAELKEPFSLLNGKDAVIDGTLKAVFRSGGETVGEAQIVLPAFGISEAGAWLKGIALDCGVKGKVYTVSIQPEKLWAMEA